MWRSTEASVFFSRDKLFNRYTDMKIKTILFIALGRYIVHMNNIIQSVAQHFPPIKTQPKHSQVCFSMYCDHERNNMQCLSKLNNDEFETTHK